jgi:DNA primase
VIIPREIINEIIAKTDIVELISETVQLRKAGKDFTARCPLPTHKEKTASFTVSPSKQFFHCFGCKGHGNAIRWLIDSKGMDFREAVEMLAKRAGIQLPSNTEDDGTFRRKRALQEILEAAADAYAATGARRQELRQFAVQRGLTDGSIADFQLGFAPKGGGIREAIEHTLSRKVTDDELLECGLFTRDDAGAMREMFRNRVMFPIRDRSGAVVGFGGRSDTSQAKYLNSPDTPLFAKDRILYGLDRARRSIRQEQRAIVVEGYMDVAQTHQVGVTNVVATMGTAISEYHVRELLHMTDEVVFCFDGDAAGEKAAERAMEVCLPIIRDGQAIRFAFLPEGDDPDDFIRAAVKQGGDPIAAGRAFDERCVKGQLLSAYLLQVASKRAGEKLSSPEARVRAHRFATELVAKIKAPAYAAVIRHSLEEQLGIALPAPTPLPAHYARSAPGPGRGGMPDPMKIEERMLMVAVYHPAATRLLDSNTITELREAVLRGEASQEIEATLEIARAARAEELQSASQVLEVFRESHLEAIITSAAASADRYYASRNVDMIEQEFSFAAQKMADVLRQRVIISYLDQKGPEGLDEEEVPALREALANRRAGKCGVT